MKVSHELKKKKPYWKLASVSKTFEDKINFYDLHPDAFELDSNPGKELAKAMSYFQEEWDIDPYEYQAKHGDFPGEFKIYAFEKLILRGNAYSQFSGPND